MGPRDGGVGGLTLYIIQAESLGIPEVPELFIDKNQADAAYKLAWAEALGVYDDWRDGTLNERLAQFEKDWANSDDFEHEFWPGDSGVRMWALIDDELPEGLVITESKKEGSQ